MSTHRLDFLLVTAAPQNERGRSREGERGGKGKSPISHAERRMREREKSGYTTAFPASDPRPSTRDLDTARSPDRLLKKKFSALFARKSWKS